jgi:TolB-like protein/DNA-binding winged helix-turn-helix (wHTH) protein/tetratricopeptide (TPR) repeat protein
MASRTYEFGPFRLDAERRALLRDGEPIPLTPKAFDLLVVLVEGRDRVAEKAELMRLLWPDRAVEESNLTQNVFALRRALGDGPGDKPYIETIPRHGYRFVAEVRTVQGEAAAPRTRPRVLGSVAMLTLVLAALGAYRWSHARELGTPSPAGTITSLAVLPLQNLSNDPAQEYFADGLTDALITDLAKLSPLRVISRTSVMRYKGVSKPVREIAEALGVDAVVEGSVLRSGDHARITVQLIDAAADRHLWSDSFERDLGDVVTLQGEVARAIAREINVVLTPEQDASLTRRPVSVAAHEAYLRGRFFWNKRTPEGLREAVARFEEAIRIDPDFAAAHAGLAAAYAVMPTYAVAPPQEAYPKARAAATRAIELDDGLAEAHACLGFVLLHYDWDWPGSERELKRAIELNPGSATARQWHSEWLTAQGRHDAALEEIRRAGELDPLAVSIQANLGRQLFFTRRYAEAIEALRTATRMEPHLFWAHGILAYACAHAGRHAEARDEAERARDLSGGDTMSVAYVHAVAGETPEAERLLPALEADAEKGFAESYYVAGARAVLGHREPALGWLLRAERDRSPMLMFLGVDPAFDKLRDDPRFAALLRRVGLSPPPASS